MLASKENNEVLENLNDKLSELMNDRGIIASYLTSPLSKITNPEHTSQFKLVKDPSSNWVNDLLMHNTLPVTLSNNLLTFRDPDKTFELQGDLLKMITSKNYNVDLGNSQERKIMYDFAKEMYFDERAPVNKSTRDRSLIRLLKSPGIIVSGSGVPSSQKKIFLKNKIFYHLILENYVIG